MSTFNGKLVEIKNISVDRFDGDNLISEAYFLSHCHSDHMVGLSQNFFENLRCRNVYLYGSEITVLILRKLFGASKACTKVLASNDSTLVGVGGEYLTVTTIPAGHCPGSVMFVFENTSSRILYTGDFRIDKGDIKKFNQWHDSTGTPVKFDRIYLDTTFLNNNFIRFPSRTESTRVIGEVIDQWTKQGAQYQVYLQTCAKYGSENLFASIYSVLNKQVHVSANTYHVYKQIPELSSATTPDLNHCQIHCCRPPCEKCSNSSVVRTIKPSAMYWENVNVNGGKIHFSNSENLVRVCYSCHASYEELEHFVKYLKPKAVYACVTPDSLDERRELNAILASWTGSYDNEAVILDNNVIVKKRRLNK